MATKLISRCTRDKQLWFSHQTVTYVFRGRAIDPPRPGTYDAAAWTPPTHRIFDVSIQNDGLWFVRLFDAIVAAGEGAKPSPQEALAILYRHCEKLL